MNAPDNSSMVERSITVRFFRRLFTWRTLRRGLIALAWLAALIAVFHGFENWRGRRAWNQYRQALEAQGEPLDFKAVIPQPIPDDQNFAATPLVKSWFVPEREGESGARAKDDYGRAEARMAKPKTKGVPADRRFLDLVAWSQALAVVRSTNAERAWEEKVSESMKMAEPSPSPVAAPPPPPLAPPNLDIPPSGRLDPESRAQAAPAVLEGLKTNETLFAELRVASQRPHSVYPVNYDAATPFAILLPHLKMVRSTCQRLQLKACAELARGQSENAFEDLRLLLYLADSLKGEPFLISHLVRLACVQLAAQPIWEGLAEHRWSEMQLRELESRLQQYHLLAELRTALGTEEAGAISTIELIREKGYWYLNTIGASDSTPAPREPMMAKFLGAVLIPQGWYYQEELNYARGFHTQLATGLDAANNRVSPTQVKADARAFERMIYIPGFAGTGLGRVLHHRLMAGMLMPALSRAILKPAAAQTTVNQAAIACALERYRLANGHFPEKLEALARQSISPLPEDVLTGEPYKYRRTDDGQFVVYSVGWNEKDDGGVPGKTMFDDEQGDWVWEYPAK